jgi:hypothetical protein
MKHYLVDVICIAPGEPRERFDPEVVERLADSILESGGLLKPLVLKATGPESYRVVGGHLEYWAAVRAREKDPRKGEMINAFVVSPNAGLAIERQLAALKSVDESDSGEGSGEEPADEFAPSLKKELAAVDRMMGKFASIPAQMQQIFQEPFDRLERKISSFDVYVRQIAAFFPRMESMERSFQEKMRLLDELLKKPSAQKRTKSSPAIPQEPFTRASLENATIPMLKEIAKEKEIDCKGLKKKQEFVEAILNAVK